MFSDGDLARMRTVAGTAALPDTAVVYTHAYVSDGGGGGSTTWTVAGTTPCRIAPLGGAENLYGGRISPDADSIITLRHDATITTNSRLVANGGTYNVEYVRDRSWELTTRVEARKEN
jgi:SPP1 family predicted phage head-tail adaptor